mmetsp:Transcript_68577/g.192209  ORF Transcript_68577/g.192209 Transcript_68577/m.192209 type:complete len:370 (-) Transcript_68577:469-1578(-)
MHLTTLGRRALHSPMHSRKARNPSHARPLVGAVVGPGRQQPPLRGLRPLQWRGVPPRGAGVPNGRDPEALGAIVHAGRLAGQQLRGDDALRQGADDVALEPAPQGPGAELRVVGLREGVVQRRVGDAQLELLLPQPPPHVLELQPGDAAQHRPGEGVEDDDVVDAVQQLRAQGAPDRGQALLLGRRQPRASPRRLQERRLPHVRGHDEDGVAAVHQAPLGVRDAPVVQDLQEHVQHVRVRLLELVEEDDGVGVPTQALRELPPLLVADVARRSADEPRHGVLLHVLGHVEAQHLRLAVEELLGQGLGHLRLPHARRSREEEGAHGPRPALQLRRADQHRPRHRVGGLLLPKDPGLQRRTQPQQPLALRL